MEELLRDFKAVVAAVAEKGLDYVRGRLWDPESGIACATGLLVANRARRPLQEALDGLGIDALRFAPDSHEARELRSLTQFEADDILADTYGVPMWQAQFAAAKEDSGSVAMIAAIQGPADLVQGGRGEPLVEYVGYLGTRTPEDWSEIRRRSEAEYERVRPLIAGELRATSTLVNAEAGDAALSDLAFAQYWTRAVAFRSLHSSRRESVGTGSEEWDSAWLAWGTDLARRGAIEILAQGLGTHLESELSVLPMLAWQN